MTTSSEAFADCMASSVLTTPGRGSPCEGAGGGAGASADGAAGTPDHRPNQDPLGCACGWAGSMFSAGNGWSTSIGFVGSVGSTSTGFGSAGFDSAGLGSSSFAASSGLGSVDACTTGWAFTGLPNHPPSQPGAGCVVGVASAVVVAPVGCSSGGPASGRFSWLSSFGPSSCGIGAPPPVSSMRDGSSRSATTSPFSNTLSSSGADAGAISKLIASGSFLVLKRLRSTAVFDLTVPPKMVSRATWMEAADFRGREPYQLCFLCI